MSEKPLNDGEKILQALRIKGGHGVVTKLARDNNLSKTCLSNTLHGRRKNPTTIRIIADFLGRTVYGIEPQKQ